MRSEQWDLEIFPKEEVDGDTFRLRVQAEREQEVVPKKLERLKRKYGNVEMTSREVEQIDPVAQFTEVWALDHWARVTAKITLGVAAYLEAWDWRNSPAGEYVAALAREGMDAVGEPPTGAGVVGLPHVVARDDLITKVVVPPRHLLWIDERGQYLGILLFGQFQLAAKLGDAWVDDNVAWLFDPQARTVEQGPYTAVFGRLVMELNEREDTDKVGRATSEPSAS